MSPAERRVGRAPHYSNPVLNGNNRTDGIVVTHRCLDHNIKEHMPGTSAAEMPKRGEIALAFEFCAWGREWRRNPAAWRMRQSKIGLASLPLAKTIGDKLINARAVKPSALPIGTNASTRRRFRLRSIHICRSATTVERVPQAGDKILFGKMG